MHSTSLPPARRRRAGHFSFVPVAFATVAALSALSGCGGGGIPLSSGASSTTGGLAIADFAGRSYTSQVILSEGQRGTLSATVSTDGTATGTLAIIDTTRAKSMISRDVPIATPFLNGTFNPLTGALSLSGSYTINGQTIPISIAATLPVPPVTTGGSVHVTVNGQAFTSSFGSSVSATPTPSPSASPSPTPTPAPGTLNQITVQGTGANNQVSVLNGQNITAEGFRTGSPAGGGYLSVKVANYLSGQSGAPDEATLTVGIFTDGPLAPGTYAWSTAGPRIGEVTYGEFHGGYRAWSGNPLIAEGQVVVEEVTDQKVRVRLVNVKINAPAIITPATGTVLLNGTVETTKVFLIN